MVGANNTCRRCGSEMGVILPACPLRRRTWRNRDTYNGVRADFVEPFGMALRTTMAHVHRAVDSC